jgi:hypothetical protein
MNDAQIKNSQYWELLLAEGKCNLNEALYMCMKSGEPISKYMIDQFDNAITGYCRGQYDDLAEAFGIAMTKRAKQSMAAIDSQRTTIVVVDLFHEQGFSKNNPNHYQDTAFHKAAEAIAKSPSRVYELYQQGKKDLK